MEQKTKEMLLEKLPEEKRNILVNVDFDLGDHLKQEFLDVVMSREVYIYEESAKDSENDNVYWFVYADHRNDRIWLLMFHKPTRREFLGYVSSQQKGLKERFFGISSEDAKISYAFADCMMEFYRGQINE